jgi:LysM repeat protein
VKKSIWLAIIGAAALAGCQNEVMQQREYVPAPREDIGPATQAVDNADMPVRQDVGTAQTMNQDSQLPAPQEIPAMTQTFDNNGVDENAPTIDRDGKKGGKGVKGGKKAGPGEYIVREGDTLQRIANKHHVRLSALMKANNLTKEDETKLRIGRKLVIPARSAAPGKGAGAQAKQVKAGPGEYILREGDTPEKIARKHHVRLSALMEANNLTEEDAKRLRIGQKLVIPAKGAAQKKGGAGAQPKAAPKKGTRSNAGSQSRDLEEDDNAPAPAPVKLNRVEVDDGYAVDLPKDMTVAEFSRLVNVPAAKLRELNPDMPAKQLKKGSTFIIPKN